MHGRKSEAVAAAVAGGLVAGLMTMGCAQKGVLAEHRLLGSQGDPAVALAAVQRAADVLVRWESSRTRTAMESATGGTRVTIRGVGAFDYAQRVGRLRLVLPRDAAGAEPHRPITELLAPGALYMKNRGAGVPADKWVRVDTAGLADGNLVTGGATDPITAAELLRGAWQVTYVGDEWAEGVAVRHYRGVAGIGRAAKAAESAPVRRALEAAAGGFAEDTVRFDAYLDEQGRLRKVRHRFTFANGGDRGTDGVEVASTTELYDFGAEVSVELPEEEEIYGGRVAIGGA